ncbi:MULTISPECIES: NAD(P)/FAD-dependent oxidoreductase [Arthrobacter]|uniref:FAD-dependent oxidoreductase n=1 Tax=Arthrobacter terricola TaxID=2547396 RepID=A0A4R5KB74_9MICC|nr:MULTISPECIES: NAD(P)/FAD-dependent oxidoreductase [Arthrobacter]MBT8162711.1 NAD(P)/FAD-dependent oxidoreductase [Arthrobacter sp. GN70]TDF92483.1 FAD-dependent oxidoreductase [Arthrobacter terricola]
MKQEDRVVVVGSGIAGAACAATLRERGYDGGVTVVRGEDALPYNRTAVNTTMLSAGHSHVELTLPEAQTPDVEWLARDEAEALDPARREVRLASGKLLRYRALVIATGVRARPWPGSACPVPERVVTLRTSADAARMRSLLGWSGKPLGRHGRVIIMGAGFIGGETASLLSGAEVEVDLVARQPVPMSDRLGRNAASWLLERHNEHAHPHVGRTVAGWTSGEDRVMVRLDDGRRLAGDLLLVAAGSLPNTEWLQGSGLDVEDGVAVDPSLRAIGADGVYAAGDVARVATTPRARRTENWASARAQGRHAARSVLHDLGLGEAPGPFSELPVYTSKMYGTKLTLLGETGAGLRQTAIPGDVPGPPTTVFTDERERLRGAVAMGVPQFEDSLVEAVRHRIPLSGLLPAAAVGKVHN